MQFTSMEVELACKSETNVYLNRGGVQNTQIHQNLLKFYDNKILTPHSLYYFNMNIFYVNIFQTIIDFEI